MKKVTAFLMGLFTVIALTLFNPAPAQASHVGPFILLKTYPGDAQTIQCIDHNGNSYVDIIQYNHFSQRNCIFFKVRDNERIKYQSLTTGAYYWTKCGEEEPNNYEQIGNSVQIVQRVSYPTAPANVC